MRRGALGEAAPAGDRARGRGVRAARDGVPRLDRRHDPVVDPARPVVGLLQPRAHLPRVRGARGVRRVAPRASVRRLDARRARRADVRVGPGREGRACAVRRLRTAGAASISRRVLERARARGGVRDPDRAVGGDAGPAAGACGRRRGAVRAPARAAPHVLARGDPVGARRARDLVRPDSRPLRRRAGVRRRRRAGRARVRSRAAPARDHGGRAAAQRAGARRARLRAGGPARWGRRLRARVLRALPAGPGARTAPVARGSGRGDRVRRGRRRRGRGERKSVRSADRGRPGAEPARRGQPQQPLGVVEGGVARLGGRAARRDRGGVVRARPPEVPRLERGRPRAARPAAAVRVRDGSRGAAPVGRGDRGGAARGVACSGTAPRRRAGSGACVGHRPARVPRPRAARLRLGLRRAVRGRLLRDRLPARDRSRADPRGPRVRVGRGRRARDVGGALLDRGAADRRPPGQRGLLADRERLVRRGRDREERALAEPARDRAARGLGCGGGDVRTARPRAQALCSRGRPPASELADLVRARAVRQAGARRQGRRAGASSAGRTSSTRTDVRRFAHWDGLATTEPLERGRKRGARGGALVLLRRARAQAVEGRAGRAVPLRRRRRTSTRPRSRASSTTAGTGTTRAWARRGRRSSSTSRRSAAIR